MSVYAGDQSHNDDRTSSPSLFLQAATNASSELSTTDLIFGGNDGSLWLPEYQTRNAPLISESSGSSLSFGTNNGSIWAPLPTAKATMNSLTSNPTSFNVTPFDRKEETLSLPNIPSTSLLHDTFNRSSTFIASNGPSRSPQDERPGNNRIIGDVKRPAPTFDLNPWQ